MSLSKRTLTNLFVLCLLVIVFFSFGITRYWSPSGGVSSTSGDLGIYVAISEHISSGLLFPELHKTAQDVHSVSKYLPIYHGLLGFPLLAMAFEKIGMPRLGSYQAVLDLSLVIILWSFLSFFLEKLKTGWRWEYLLAGFFVVPIFLTYFASAASYAFFSQLLSQAMLVLAAWCWHQRRYKLAAFFLFWGVFSYPDFLIPLIPVFLFTTVARPWSYLKTPAALVWVVLMYIPLQRAHLPGPYASNLYPFILVALTLIIFSKELFKRDRPLFIFVGAHVIYGVVALLYGMENFNPSYYAMKICSLSYFLLPYLWLKLPLLKEAKGRVLTVCCLVFLPQFGEVWNPQIPAYFRLPSGFNNSDYAKSLDIKNNLHALSELCELPKTVVLPNYTETNEQRQILSLMISNSLLLSYDIYSYRLLEPQLNQFLNSAEKHNLGLIHSARNDPGTLANGLVEFLKKLKEPKTFCVVTTSPMSEIFNQSGLFTLLKTETLFSYFKFDGSK